MDCQQLLQHVGRRKISSSPPARHPSSLWHLSFAYPLKTLAVFPHRIRHEILTFVHRSSNPLPMESKETLSYKTRKQISHRFLVILLRFFLPPLSFRTNTSDGIHRKPYPPHPLKYTIEGPLPLNPTIRPFPSACGIPLPTNSTFPNLGSRS